MQDITHNHRGTKGLYTIARTGAEAALTCSLRSRTRIIADHTDVSDARRGT